MLAIRLLSQNAELGLVECEGLDSGMQAELGIAFSTVDKSPRDPWRGIAGSLRRDRVYLGVKSVQDRFRLIHLGAGRVFGRPMEK
jgi:hypothetical protein